MHVPTKTGHQSYFSPRPKESMFQQVVPLEDDPLEVAPNDREAKIAELETLLLKAGERTESIQWSESILEAQAQKQSQRLLLVERESSRRTDSCFSSIGDQAKKLEEMESLMRRRENDYRLLLDEKQIELDRMEARLSECTVYGLKRETDGEQEVRTLLSHIQQLEESNQYLRTRNVELRAEKAIQQIEAQQRTGSGNLRELTKMGLENRFSEGGYEMQNAKNSRDLMQMVGARKDLPAEYYHHVKCASA